MTIVTGIARGNEFKSFDLGKACEYSGQETGPMRYEVEHGVKKKLLMKLLAK